MGNNQTITSSHNPLNHSTHSTKSFTTPTINMRFSTIAMIAGAGLASAQVDSILSSVASQVQSALPGVSGASSALNSIESSVGSAVASDLSSAASVASSRVASIES